MQPKIANHRGRAFDSEGDLGTKMGAAPLRNAAQGCWLPAQGCWLAWLGSLSYLSVFNKKDDDAGTFNARVDVDFDAADLTPSDP